MARMQIAAGLAALALGTPASALDPIDLDTSTMFYVRIPLDSGLSHRERVPVFGLQLQGRREYAIVRIDTKLLNLLPGAEAIEVKWIIAGALAAGAVLAISSKDKSTAQSIQTQQAQNPQPPQPCPQTPPACK